MSAQQPSPEAQSIPRPNRWPLIISPANRQEDTNKDARLVNGYMEKELQGDAWLYKRPGLSQESRPSAGAGLGQGAYNWLGDVYTIFNGHLYKNGVNKGGTINTTHGVYRFAAMLPEYPVVDPTLIAKLVFGNGYHAYAYDDTNGLVDFTGNMQPDASPFYKGWAFLDDTLYVMAPFANIWGSDINDILTWPADNVLVARIEPTRGVALAKQLVYVVAFKEDSTEIFYDAANATGSPLGRVSGAKISFGCANADSVREVDGALFWLSTNRSASVQVMRMENLKAEIISTPAIERLLGEADVSEVYSWTLKYEGHRWYAITLVNENLTLVYDMTTGLWAQWTDVDGNYLPIVDSTYKTSTAQTLLQHESNGWLYTVDSANVTDAGDVITVDIYTPNYDAGTARDKTLPAVYFDANRIPGSVLQVRYSDDDYQTWSPFRKVDLSVAKPMLQGNGTFKRRAYNLRHQSLTRFRIKAMDLQMDIGAL